MKHPRHRKIIIQGLLLLLGGAIVNVAVAWGCALIDWPTIAGTQLRQANLQWPAYIKQANWPGPDFGRQIGSGLGYRANRYEAVLAGNGMLVLETFEYGIPFRSMIREGIIALGNDVNANRGHLLAAGFPRGHGHFGSSQSYEGRGLPYGIIPMPFLLNSIVFGTLLWALFPGRRMLRRMIRRRRGQCTACGYSIAPGTGQVCSECGSPLSTP